MFVLVNNRPIASFISFITFKQLLKMFTEIALFVFFTKYSHAANERPRAAGAISVFQLQFPMHNILRRLDVLPAVIYKQRRGMRTARQQ
jgi:hypothetical protein